MGKYLKHRIEDLKTFKSFVKQITMTPDYVYFLARLYELTNK